MQPKERTTSTTDIPPMKRQFQSNASSSLQDPTEKHPEVEEAESSIAKRASSSRASSNKKATKAPLKWTKLHIKKQKEPDADKYKMDQEKLLISNPELAELTPWSSFELVFDDIIDLLVEQSNLYANRDKDKMKFLFWKEEMMNFVGLLFCQGKTLEKAKETTGALTQILLASPSGNYELKSF